MILHFFYFPVSTFSAAALFQQQQAATFFGGNLFGNNFTLSLYSYLRQLKQSQNKGKKRDSCAKRTKPDLQKSRNNTTCFFFWLQNLRECILFLVDIS